MVVPENESWLQKMQEILCHILGKTQFSRSIFRRISTFLRLPLTKTNGSFKRVERQNQPEIKQFTFRKSVTGVIQAFTCNLF